MDKADPVGSTEDMSFLENFFDDSMPVFWYFVRETVIPGFYRMLKQGEYSCFISSMAAI